MSSVVVADNVQPRGADRRRIPRGGRRTEDRAGRHPRIAIVEPYEGVRRPCARYLEHFNFEVVEAADLDTGLAVLAASPPAVLLVEAGDTPVFERLQSEALVLGVPLLSLTTAFPYIDGSAADAPATGVLLKPFTLGAMLEEIRRLLRTAANVGPAAV